MKLHFKPIMAMIGTSLLFSTAWAKASVYECVQINGGRAQVKIQIQHPSMFSGKYIKLSDVRDGDHGPIYDYDADDLQGVPAGLPQGQYVLAKVGSLGLILDVNMYHNSDEGIVAETDSNGSAPSRIYSCQLE